MSTPIIKVKDDGCCEVNPSMASLRRLVLLLLQNHYAIPKNHGELLEPYLGCLVYQKNTKKPLAADQRGVTIELAHIDKPGEGNVPLQHAIYIDFKGAAFDHEGQRGSVSSVSEDRSKERIVYTMTGVWMFAHFAPNADTALSMCESTLEFMIAAEAFICRNTIFSLLEPVSWSEIQRFEKEPPIFRVDLKMNFKAQFIVDRSDESHRIKTTAFNPEITTQ